MAVIDSPFLTASEVADVYRRSKQWVLRAFRDGEIPKPHNYEEKGVKYQWHRDDILEDLESKRTASTSKAPSGGSASKSTAESTGEAPENPTVAWLLAGREPSGSK